MQARTESEMIDAKEAARLIGASTSWLAKARMRREGPPFHKNGAAVRYLRDDVLTWRSAQRVATN